MGRLEIQFPAAFKDMPTPRRYKVWYGGRGGAKSWSIGRGLLLMGVQRPLKVLCTREFQSSIADSVHALLKQQIPELELGNFYEVQRDSILGLNGTEFIFAGLRHNPKKVKSTEGVDIAWVEEADTISNDSLDLLIPTIRKEDSEIWFSFNPDQETDPVYHRFVVNGRDDAMVRKVTYADNPWFPEVLRKEMEYDRAHDTDKYLHVWEGEPRKASKAQVFAGKWRIGETPERSEVYYYGADWGFSQDPTVLVRCFILDQVLYIDHEAYGVGVDIDMTPQMFDRVPGARDWYITADSARPETISYMAKNGWKIRGAKKGKGSVEDGVAFLRSFKEIVVNPRCRHTIDEMRLYSYKVDRLTGDPTPDLEDKNNHVVDALRYAVEPIIRGGILSAALISAGDLGL
jgi:phage terminase large subunit